MFSIFSIFSEFVTFFDFPKFLDFCNTFQHFNIFGFCIIFNCFKTFRTFPSFFEFCNIFGRFQNFVTCFDFEPDKSISQSTFSYFFSFHLLSLGKALTLLNVQFNLSVSFLYSYTSSILSVTMFTHQKVSA